MKKYFFSLTFLLMLLSVESMAQAPAKVLGTISDKGKAVSGATVSLLKAADSSLVKAAITDITGLFEITDLSAGKYLLNYTAIGFQQKYSTVFELQAGEDITRDEVLLAAPLN